jgi:hypothetical protein
MPQNSNLPWSPDDDVHGEHPDLPPMVDLTDALKRVVSRADARQLIRHPPDPTLDLTLQGHIGLRASPEGMMGEARGAAKGQVSWRWLRGLASLFPELIERLRSLGHRT